MNKKIVVTIICIVLALASIAGVVIAIIPRNNDETIETEDIQKAEETSYESDTSITETEGRKEELTSPPEGHTPIPDLDEGNEMYLDMDVVEKLQAMENEGKEYEVNLILDTMLLLINEFVDREYSALAICQVQRFYFEFFENIGDVEFDTLCDRLAECISSNGLNADEFTKKVCEEFGFDENTDFSYVYSAEVFS
ncbi:MAG: hypothetical protein IKJ00_07145 [Clostridia bacterium]|nr:hypothetical protein [Clostridia bacterium]